MKQVTEIVEYLNSLLSLDRESISKLCLTRFPCSNEFIDNSKIVVFLPDIKDPKNTEIGLIGLLNGIIRLTEDTLRLCAMLSHDGSIERFAIYTRVAVELPEENKDGN